MFILERVGIESASNAGSLEIAVILMTSAGGM